MKMFLARRVAAVAVGGGVGVGSETVKAVISQYIPSVSPPYLKDVETAAGEKFRG
jgi:predicted Rossmann-fold nucleotide-binding protein